MTYSKICDLSLHNTPIADELEQAANRVIRSGWYTLGEEVSSFEQAFARWCGVSGARGVASGSDALELALRALGVTAGDEVITVANAGMYATTAILAIGARPVYVDVCADTLCIDPEQVAQRISSETRAVIATHLYGYLCDMEALQQVVKPRGIALVEDCAQAHGAQWQAKKAGCWGDAAAFSFYPTKNLGALGDAGAVLSNQDQVIDAVVSLQQYGWKEKYSVVRQGGRNSRLDEIQAAFLNVKLPYLDNWLAERRAIGKYYSEHIQHPLVTVLPYQDLRHAYHLYVIRCTQRDELSAYLAENNIATDIHYPLLDYQQQIVADSLAQTVCLPVSEQVVSEILTLPCYPELGNEAAEFVVKTINQWPKQ